MPEVEGRGELLRWMLETRTPRVAKVCPADRGELDAVAEVVRRRFKATGQGITLLIDEIAAWGPPSPTVLRLLRTYRHARATVVATTQHIGRDVGQPIQALAPTFRVFRLAAPTALEWAERELGLDPERVRALGVGEYLPRDDERPAAPTTPPVDP